MNYAMRLSDFDYDLPPERIAQEPLPERGASRLLWLERGTGRLEDRMFGELPELLRAGDLLVANDSRVFPARLRGRIASGGAVEVLLLQRTSDREWEALVRPGRKLGTGARIGFGPGLTAEITHRGPGGERGLRFEAICDGDIETALERLGHVPLPPYIRRPDMNTDRERYQTVYAAEGQSAAAPTAGLHFTLPLLQQLASRGVGWTTVRLDVGLGTFQPVSSAVIEQHPMHRERYWVGAEAAAAIRLTRAERRRVIAVGTTAARVLETIAPAFSPGAGATGIFLYPGCRFQAVDAMITNFHAPRTTLLMMIAAFASLEQVRNAYVHALANGYRFLSYGDAMLIT